MAYADYEHCAGCDAKVIYTCDTDVPEDVVCWHIECLAKEAAQGAAAERERIIALASQVRAQFPADHPKGAMASFADYLRVLGDAADGAHPPGGAT